MNWDHVEDEDDDFFEPRDWFSSPVPDELESPRLDEDLEDTCFSFNTAVCTSACSSLSLNNFISGAEAAVAAATRSRFVSEDYDMWMVEPGNLNERRHLLLSDMGLLSNKSLQKIASAKKFGRVITRKAKAAIFKHPLIPKSELPWLPCPRNDSMQHHPRWNLIHLHSWLF